MCPQCFKDAPYPPAGKKKELSCEEFVEHALSEK